MPVPRLFDIRRPSTASTVEVMITSVNGMSPIRKRPEKIIRFSQRRMISRAVTLLRPAGRREGPGGRREPGVEHVRVALEPARAALGARARRRPGARLV